jgi:hypothetical protein
MPSPSPLAPVLSHAAGEEGGDCAAHLPPAAPTLRERKGGIVLLTFLLLLPRCGRGRGRLCCSPSSCCSHAAGEEGGDCAAHLPPAAPTLRERKGGDCAPHLPPAAPTLRERKGGDCAAHLPPAAPTLRGVISIESGRERKTLLTFLLLLPRCGRGRGG